VTRRALLLLVYIGLRKDELRQLRVEHVDLDTKALLVHGKGGHVDTLPLGFEHVRTTLELHLRERQAGEYLLHPKNSRERPMNPASVHRWFKRALERAGLSTAISATRPRTRSTAPPATLFSPSSSYATPT
jgi:integrase